MAELASLDFGNVSISVLSLICGLIVFSVAAVAGTDWYSSRARNGGKTSAGAG